MDPDLLIPLELSQAPTGILIQDFRDIEAREANDNSKPHSLPSSHVAILKLKGVSVMRSIALLISRLPHPSKVKYSLQGLSHPPEKKYSLTIMTITKQE